MTFLNPTVLWLLPLVLLPLLGLLFRPPRAVRVPWAASRFLAVAAPRALLRLRLRRALRLLAACAALACALLAAARPLLQPGSGWSWSAAPDLVLICLDRSPAMEALCAEDTSCREAVLATMQRRAMVLADRARTLVVDEVNGVALAADPRRLAAHPAVSALDLSADLPRALALTLARIAAEAPATAEVWIGSAALGAAWQPDHPAWGDLRRLLDDHRGRVGVRWFRAPDVQGVNRSLRLADCGRDNVTGEPWLRLAVQGRSAAPLTVTVAAGEESQAFTVPPWPGDVLLFIAPLPGAGDGPVHGVAKLPADANPADNQAYFALAGPGPWHTVVACRDTWAATVVTAAAAPAVADRLRAAAQSLAEDLVAETLTSVSLVVLDQPPREAAPKAVLEGFVRSGGAVLVLPDPGAGTEVEWLGMRRGETQALGRPLAGQLADTSGELCQGLPLDRLWAQARSPLVGGTLLAAFGDGKPLLVETRVGAGLVVWCAVPMDRSASNLDDGAVLVPLVQRLLAAGAERLARVERRDCGPLADGLAAQYLLPAEDSGERRAGLRAGVLRVPATAGGSERILVLARSHRCDARDLLETTTIRALLGAALVEDTGRHTTVPWEASGPLFTAALLLLATELLAAPGWRRRP
jgi:hypothetical protein